MHVPIRREEQKTQREDSSANVADIDFNEYLRQLTVRDNGIGLPAGTDFRAASSLGMTLVYALVEQISGAIAVDGSNGTSVVVSFPMQ